jgi:hypothetical protein
MLSCCEFTGVLLSTLLDDCGFDRKNGKFVLAEGADGSGMTRTISMDRALDDVMVAWAMNGEMLRPENGYPLRLVGARHPGRLVGEVAAAHRGRRPAVGTKDEALHYVDLMPDGTASPVQLDPGVQVGHHAPSGGQMLLDKGFYNVTGLAWSGAAKVKRVDVSFDGGRNWTHRAARDPCSPSASRASTSTGVGRRPRSCSRARSTRRLRAAQDQPAARGARPRSIYHNNAIQSWKVAESGEVSNVQGISCAACMHGRVPASRDRRVPGIGRPPPRRDQGLGHRRAARLQGLPPGRERRAGAEGLGRQVRLCHGTFGESNEVFTPLVGGHHRGGRQGRARRDARDGESSRTTLMKLATISTLWDYINRAMPWNAPKSLTHR